MTNREWLSTLTDEEFVAWCSLDSPHFLVNRKKELTRYGVGYMWTSSSQRVIKWLGETRHEPQD